MARIIIVERLRRIYERRERFEDVELFIQDIQTGNSDSKAMAQLKVWGIRDEFSPDTIRNIRYIRNEYDGSRNRVTFSIGHYRVRITLTDNQAKKVLENLSDFSDNFI